MSYQDVLYFSPISSNDLPSIVAAKRIESSAVSSLCFFCPDIIFILTENLHPDAHLALNLWAIPKKESTEQSFEESGNKYQDFWIMAEPGHGEVYHIIQIT